MVLFNRTKINFIKYPFVIIVLLTATINNAQTKEEIDIDSKAKELGITTNELNGILNSALRNSGGGDPLPEALTMKFFTGQAAGDQFGVSVSTAGDVNGDGYSDVIVGAQGNDAGGTDAGRAYIFFGGISMDNTADVIMTGEAIDDRFGYSVSTAGDVNGDGYSDVIVGAYSNDIGGTDAGRVYIFFGSTSMDNTADVTMTGVTAGDRFGISVSTAGDVNGDGYSDVIVGATLSDAGGTDAGRSYIYFGGTSMDNTADVIMTGEAANDQFGVSVYTTGDVNGDGYSDVIVGAPWNDAGGSNAGRSYIYFGGTSMDNTADVTMTGEAAGDFFGYSVSTAGDVNGDGYSDVIVGARLNDAGGTDAGRSYIYFGGASVDNIADVTMTGVTSGDLFGTSVSAAGDVNGDGYSDIIVSANVNDAGGSNAGRVYIFFGGTSMDNIADVIMTGEAAGDLFGSSVSTAGDVNGDGYSDVIVGAHSNDAGGSGAGRAFLYLNSLTGPDIPDEFFTGEAADDYFGYSVSTAGDVNGDGYSDVIIGAYRNDAGGSIAGRTYIYFGGTSMDNTADVIMTGEAVDDYFGVSVSTAGDVNGDGYSDVIVGALWNGAGGNGVGRSYIYFGGASMDNVADVTMTGEAAGDWFGHSVSTAGDVNGDGYGDVIVGAYNFVGSNAGRSYIYFGGTSMDNTADVTMTGEVADDDFGISVSTAGDVNGDGYNDVIVGASSNDAGGDLAGRAYIYFGGASMDNSADVTMTGEAVGDRFGTSVSTAGDVNGDGYSDIIVGANFNDAGGNIAGRSYIYFGGISMDSSADVTMTGEAADNRFGVSVSTAGDVNGDGYSDVIVGAYHNAAGGSNAGRSYIYFGGTSMDNIADVTMTGEAVENYFGYSVSTAGDVNGDGYSDVIVGAFGNDAGGDIAGRSYLYLSSSPPIKPRIMSVKDVPFDQGGYVHIKWVRSGYDVNGIERVTGYVVERSLPPAEMGFAWEEVANITARKNSFYLYTASTWSDSSTNSSGTIYFRVTAITSNPSEYWRSNIMSGHSLDNLAPLAPEAFYAQNNGSDIKLGWKANAEPDLKNYVIYRTDYPGAEPDTLTPLAQVTDTTFIDTNPLPVTSYYYLRAQDINNNLSSSATTNVSVLTFPLTVSIEDGWNMVSVPGVNPDGQGVDFWWSGKDPAANVFKYVDGPGYIPVTTAAPTEGYWMKHSGANVYETGDEWPAGGIQIVSHVSISATAGWNLIGGYETSVSTGSLTTTPPGLITGPVYGYVAGPGYYIADNLVPGYGYWIKLTAAGLINIPPEPLSKGSIDVVEYFKEDWGKIIITDNAGRSYTLYAVKGEVDLDGYELPPSPPVGMFDIRYGSDRIAEDINSSIQSIEMSGIEHPVRVRIENMSITLQDETGNQINENLKAGEEITISNTLINKLMVLSGEIITPDEYALEQNYPNPFNPSTTIKFGVPKESIVKLSIYNVLGELVSTLVNEEKLSGTYEVEFNATVLSSGIYFYRLQAGSFVETKKMVLMK